MKYILFVLLFFICTISHGQKLDTVEKKYSDVTGKYIVSFSYDPHDGASFVPAAHSSKEHFPARVTVYKIVGTKRTKLVDTFNWTFIPDGGCYEDEPKWLVERAKNPKK